MHNYDDIINLPHFEPKNHPRMSIENRSAQFAPFSALTGFNEEIIEKGRLTNSKKILSETRKETINSILQYLEEHLNEHFKIRIIYFQKDNRKAGGKYIEEENSIKKFDLYHKIIILDDLKKISINDLYQIELIDSNYEDFNI